VSHERRNIDGDNRVFLQPVYNPTNESGVHATTTVLVRPTYQKGNVSIFEEVFVVSYERIIGWIGALVDAGGCRRLALWFNR
jgi:hypothetical protein